MGLPVMAGWSRKSTLGAVTGRGVGERLAGSIAAALLAVQHGATIVRVHDVAATRDAFAVLAGMDGPRAPGNQGAEIIPERTECAERSARGRSLRNSSCGSGLPQAKCWCGDRACRRASTRRY